MSLLKKAILQVRLPILETRRFRGKINIQRPRKPHFERQLLLDLCKPHYGLPKHELPYIETCTKGIRLNQPVIENPFENILARECFNWFKTSKMIIFLHMNSITMEDKMKVFVALRKQDMHLRTYGSKIVRMATTGTKFENVNLLFQSHNDIIFGQNDNVARLLKIMKKAPQMIVMAGIVHDQFLSRKQLVEFSLLPNIQTAQSILCSTLQSAASNVVSQLNQHQQTLVAHLDKHAELKSSTKEELVSKEKLEEPSS